jgi:integrase/recombinase XerD
VDELPARQVREAEYARSTIRSRVWVLRTFFRFAERPGVFVNRRGEPLTRFGIHAMVERYAARAAEKMPSVATKRVSPHTIRHTTATHLLRAGVDINTIRAWLGDVSLATTNVYAEVDLEMKAKALASCETGGEEKPQTPWREDKGLMAFLRTL